GTWMGHILEHCSLELQCLAGTPVTYGKCRGAGKPGVYYVIYSYDEERVGLAAGEIARKLLCSLLPPSLPSALKEPFDFPAARAGARLGGEGRRPGARAAPRVGGRRGQAPGPPLLAAQRSIGGAVGPGGPPAAHRAPRPLGAPPHRGGDRPGQGADQQALKR